MTVATGGSRVDALPYPFGHVGLTQYNDFIGFGTNNNGLAAGASIQLPMHPRDWRYKAVPWETFEASSVWQYLVQRGTISVSVASETNNRDEEEIFMAAV